MSIRTIKSKALLRACFLLLCFIAGTWELSITKFEVPPLIELGKDADLSCQYELADDDDESSVVVKWFWTPALSPSYDKILIYQRISGRAPMTFRRRIFGPIDIKENDTISLMSIHPLSSGVYECGVSSYKEDARKNETLTVISGGTGPVIKLNEIIEDSTETKKKNELLKIECSAEDVAPPPNLGVSINGHNVKTVTFIEDVNHDALYKATANVIVSGDHILNGDNEVKCEMSFFQTNDTVLPWVAITKFVVI
ncbi:unnamed protein product [Arctia plantaginis]|uniref:Ig-like domain-containing protein n=1 Tax=Arctia plantaginis TaxID=874455 RepID=A0A8S1AGU7_ARCPL|nr:unnamed protein product [Arctia plantaginis]